MLLEQLTVRDFRNLAEETVAFHPRANILVGKNGQGKTNFLESLYFLATTKSFRTARAASLFRFGSPSLFVSGVLERDGLRKTLSAGLETGESKRRVLMVNGEKVTLPAYLNAMAVFAYSQDRLAIVRGTPEERRRFLDRGIASLQPGYLEQLTRFGRVLKQRNALLAEIAQHRESPVTLDAWDAELVDAAAVVHRARAAYAAELAAELAAIVERHRYHVTGLEMRYQPSGVDALAASRRAEIRARVTLSGPQRDLVEFFVNGKPAADVLSGGEQKMIVLFLKFAKIALFRRRNDDAPLFVLDDVDAELDLEILQDLLSRLPESTQVFATSAKEAFLASLEAGPHRRLTVENGRVSSSRDFA